MEDDDKKVAEALSELSTLISQQNSLLSGTLKSVGDATSSSTTVTLEQSNNTKSGIAGANADDKLAQANQKAAAAMEQASQNYKAAFGKGIDSLKNFTGAVLSTEDGVSKYGEAVSDLGEGALAVGSNFGILGLAIGGVLAIFGKLVKEVLKVDDNIIGMRDNFAKTAGVLPITTTELGNLAKNARFSMDNMKTLGKEMSGLGQNVMGLGGYAGEGGVKFLKMAAVSDEVRQSFGRMGISQDELLHLQANYVEQQAVSGQAYQNSTKTIEQLQKESLEYAKNMTVLSSITGKSADTLQKEIDQVELEFEEQVQEMAENAKIKKLKAAGRFEEAAAVQREKDNRTKMIQMYTAMYGPEKAQQMARVMRTGAIDSKTASLAMMPGMNVVQFANKLKKSTDASADLLEEGSKLDKSMDEQAAQFNDGIQYGGEGMGKKLGLEQEAVLARNKRAGMDIKEGYQKAADEMEKKSKAGQDPLADKIESVRSFEREAQAREQSFLEGLDPLRNKNNLLKDAVIAAAIALGAMAALKVGQGLISKVGGMLGGGGGAGGAAGAAEKIITIKEDQLLDKNGNPLRGAAKAARINKLTGGNLGKLAEETEGKKPSGFAESLKEIGDAFKQAGKDAPMIIAGAAAIGAAIAEIGAGIAGATWIMGKALKSFAENLKGFNNIDGANLKAVGLGMLGLGVGIFAMGAGAMLGAIATIMKFFTGGKDPLQEAVESLVKLQAMNLDSTKIKDNGAAIMAYAASMAAVSALGAGKSIGDSVSGMFNALGAVFGGPKKPPYEELDDFAKLKINTEQVKNNSLAFKYFGDAMASFTGNGSTLGGIGAAMADGAVKFFKTKPPAEQMVQFSKLNIETKDVQKNSKAFVAFSTAMAAYKGGPGLLSAVSTIAGAKLTALFGADGPLESFQKFGKLEIPPKAAENSLAFFNWAKAMGILSGGQGGFLDTLAGKAREALQKPTKTVSGGGGGGGGETTPSGPGASLGKATKAVPGEVKAQLEEAGITNPFAQLAVLGNIYKETGFQLKDENLSYGHTPDTRIRSVFGSRAAGFSDDQLDSIKQDPFKMGEFMYGKDTKIGRSMGNTEEGDGFKYRGRGFIQITGKSNYSSLGKLAGIDLVGNPNSANDPKYATAITAAFIKRGMGNKINSFTDQKQANEAVTQTVGGSGLNLKEGIGAEILGKVSAFTESRQAKVGGMFEGPTSGYPMELHGTELVIPLDKNSILTKLASTSESATIKNLEQKALKAMPKPTTTTTTTSNKVTKGVTKEMIGSLSKKFDNVIGTINRIDNVQKKILTQTM